MKKVKMITSETKLSELEIVETKWDLQLGDVMYKVVHIKGYPHTIYADIPNEYWCYPRFKEMSVNNLIPYTLTCPVKWGVLYEPKVYKETHYGDPCLRHEAEVFILRNGVKFCKTKHNGLLGVHEAPILINDIQQMPINFNNFDYMNELIGRKIVYKGELAIITNFYEGSVSIKYDGYNDLGFTHGLILTSNENNNRVLEINTSIFDKNIWWWRE